MHELTLDRNREDIPLLKKKKKKDLFMAVLALHCCADFSLVGGPLSSWWTGFSLRWHLLLQGTALGHAGFSSCGFLDLEPRLSTVVHRLSCSEACGIFPDLGLNLCLLHLQVDSLPLSHQGSLKTSLLSGGKVEYMEQENWYHLECCT